MNQPVVTDRNRSVARVVIGILAALVVLIAGIAVLVGTTFGGKDTKDWVGAGLVAAAVAIAALLL